MKELLGEVVIRMLINVILNSIGAAVRWLFLFKKYSYKTLFAEGDDFRNIFLGGSLLVSIILSVFLLK
ncbi:hypothetical protein ACLI1A_05425 [Flavobacterium sp. RHBU_3]|uniref:hypothetical protein n=1 Tax=Flavobacterium sp. RHBU_3 TaxID=3391184 RepID=UPI0039856700